MEKIKKRKTAEAKNYIGIRVTTSMYNEITRICNENDYVLSSFIRALIEKGLEGYRNDY